MNEDLRKLTGLEEIKATIRKRRLRWSGHAIDKDSTDWVRKTWKQRDVEGTRPRGRPRKTWETRVNEDCALLHLTEDAIDRTSWKALIAARPTLRTGRGCKRR